MSPYRVPAIKRYENETGKGTIEIAIQKYKNETGKGTIEIIPRTRGMATYQTSAGFTIKPIKLYIGEDSWESRKNICVEIKKRGNIFTRCKIYTGHFSLNETYKDIPYKLDGFEIKNKRGKLIKGFEKSHIEAIKDTPKDPGRYGKRILKNIKVFENNAKLLVEDLDKKFSNKKSGHLIDHLKTSEDEKNVVFG